MRVTNEGSSEDLVRRETPDLPYSALPRENAIRSRVRWRVYHAANEEIIECLD